MLSILLAIAAAAGADPVLPPRPMEVEIGADPITDAVEAWATIRGPDGRLEVGCDRDRHEGIRVRLASRHWLASGAFRDGRPLISRFDLNPPGRSLWRIEGRTAVLARRRHIAPFLQWLATSERLVVRARDIEGRTVDMHFPLVGVRPALDRVLTACGAR